MKLITLQDVKKLAIAAKGKVSKIYVHWTAGRYQQYFEDYHFNIGGNGELMVTTNDLAEKKNHTYHRNTGAVGIALACCLDAVGEHNLGSYPPTTAQIECMAQVLAVLCKYLDIPCDVQHVMTHAEAADNKDGSYPHDPYGPDTTCERWDGLVWIQGDRRWSGGDLMRGKANWYAQNLNI